MHRDSGQVAVEAALVMPVWLLIAVGAIQLALLQQARLMTEYAAYSAARAGSVWSGNNERMRDAALFALLPTFGGTATLEALGETWGRARALDRVFHEALAGTTPAPSSFKSSGLLGAVRVEVLSPKAPAGAPAELRFDDPLHPLILTVRVRVWSELRIPFANQVIFAAWSTLAAASANPTGLPALTAPERALLASLARGEGPLGSGRRYFIPLSATWSVPMQSDFHRKWLMQEEAGP